MKPRAVRGAPGRGGPARAIRRKMRQTFAEAAARAARFRRSGHGFRPRPTPNSTEFRARWSMTGRRACAATAIDAPPWRGCRGMDRVCGARRAASGLPGLHRFGL
jgi:hypothetical protein